ncbi:MAG: small ribosomal subunit Rsm22 family protein [Bradymonadia bacterium]
MSRTRKQRRRRGPRLKIPEMLIDALGTLEGGELSRPEQVTRIAEGVKAIHRGLTVDRRRWMGGGYMAHKAQGAAYGTYYLCANLPKLWPILDRMAHRGLIKAGALKILEVGGGPGTGTFAAALWAQARGWPLPTVHLTDIQRDPLSRARALWKAMGWPAELLTTATVDLTQPLTGQVARSGFDLALACNVFNEIETAHDERALPEIAALLKPTGCLVSVEPAVRELSRRALALRDTAVEKGWRVVMPCTHQGPCPALEDERDWCHGEWNFERPDFMAEVDRRVGTRREVLKATWWVATPPRHPGVSSLSVPEGLRPARVVSERFDQKGRTALVVCDLEGRRRLELQRRDAGPDNAPFGLAVRHDLLALPPGTEGRLSPDTPVIALAEVPDSSDTDESL